MAQKIQFKIIIPSKALPPMEVAQVSIPAFKGMMTIIPDRAPTTVLLTTGVLEILDENSGSVKKYFIQGGVANISQNECVIMTERALDCNEVDIEKISELKEDHARELKELGLPTDVKDSETEFYDYMSHYLSIRK